MLGGLTTCAAKNMATISYQVSAAQKNSPSVETEGL
ncbi:MAG: hypothetical protein JWP81_1062 [Ferruginibacter sp.]|nr:hypothetical protein [Ferruginibacter sp.]